MHPNTISKISDIPREGQPEFVVTFAKMWFYLKVMPEQVGELVTLIVLVLSYPKRSALDRSTITFIPTKPVYISL